MDYSVPSLIYMSYHLLMEHARHNDDKVLEETYLDKMDIVWVDIPREEVPAVEEWARRIHKLIWP